MELAEVIRNVGMVRICGVDDAFMDLPLGSRRKVIAHAIHRQAIQADLGVELPSEKENEDILVGCMEGGKFEFDEAWFLAVGAVKDDIRVVGRPRDAKSVSHVSERRRFFEHKVAAKPEDLPETTDDGVVWKSIGLPDYSNPLLHGLLLNGREADSETGTLADAFTGGGNVAPMLKENPLGAEEADAAAGVTLGGFGTRLQVDFYRFTGVKRRTDSERAILNHEFVDRRQRVEPGRSAQYCIQRPVQHALDVAGPRTGG
jgi:hypothetical protein